MFVAEPTYQELVELVASQALVIAAQAELIEKLTARVAELERRLGADSSNSSRPPSFDSPFMKKPAKARSSRKATGRKPGKQPGDPGVSRSLADHPDQVVNIDPSGCAGCSGRWPVSSTDHPPARPDPTHRLYQAIGPRPDRPVRVRFPLTGVIRGRRPERVG